ncbi:polynucleotide adenylyltransferase PcnB [Geomesophilobacter sediminis]|uniref:Poly(A) polymerase I n=1 Tax=Geomesophilobacter sediminis TaxID=2798584 RepID=A0A8J7J8R0_9BACT|nr:polynucleotide adenylyltransferase PcnB [Geomesophilobacter sediminis]MBJ6726071.1 polynucleotide adenylyltransferase PcnB [Geomesophilobacter sediminis]
MNRTPQKNVIPRAEHCISRSLLSPNGVRVLYKLKEQGFTAYLVGGGVRDLLLGREPKDFDVVTDATPNELKRIFRNCRLIGRRFRLAHLHFHDEIVEVATFRSTAENAPEPEDEPLPEPPVEVEPEEGQEPPRRRERRHHHGPSLLKSEDGMVLRDNLFGTPEEDAVRRDFTVNALFYNIADFSIIDYVGGMEDLKAGVIRTIGEPQVRFTEDPVRMIRAVRFASMLGFNIENETLNAIHELCDSIVKASPPRLYEEVLKLLMMGAGERTYQMLRQTGLFAPLFPHFDAWLSRESEGFPHVRVSRALDWVDERLGQGEAVSQPLFIALVFGEYLEEKIAQYRGHGLPSQQATDAAIADFAGELSPTVLVPNRVLIAVREILSCQHRFQKTPGRNARGVLARKSFPDALAYLRFLEQLTPVKRSLADWWERYLHQNPLAGPPQESGAEQGEESGPAKKKRRRRRRRKPAATPA